MRRGISIALVAMAATLPAGCGGEDEPDAAPQAPTGAEGERQIKELFANLYSTNDDAQCEVYSTASIDAAGGMDACLNNIATSSKTPYKLVSIDIVNGEEATAVTKTDTGNAEFQIVAEGGRWKLASPGPFFFE